MQVSLLLHIFSTYNCRIKIEFDTEAESRVIEPDLLSKFTSGKKSKVCGCCYAEMS